MMKTMHGEDNGTGSVGTPKPFMIDEGIIDDGYESRSQSAESFYSESSYCSSNKDSTKQRLGKKETQAVTQWKLILLAILATAMVGVSIGVYYYICSTQYETFERSFFGDSTKVLEALGSTLDQTLGAVDLFLVGLTSYAVSTNSKWPFVTLPHYGTRTSKVRSLSKAVAMGKYHVIKPEYRKQWEKYSVTNDAWVDQVMEVQRSDPTFFGLDLPEYRTMPVIFNNSVNRAPDGQPMYLAYWQSAPMIPYFPPYNWDAYSGDFSLMPFLNEVLENRRVVLSHVNNLIDQTNPNSEASIAAAASNAWIRGYVAEGEDHEEPWSNIYYPILEGVADAVEVDPSDPNTKVVGIMSVTFYWRDMIKDVLPPGSDGMVAVFNNGDCNQTFTYQINGPDTIYLGFGDLHNSKYDCWEQSSRLNDLDTYSTRNSAYTGLPLTDSACPWVVRTYPSDTMEALYLTNESIIFSVAVMLIFAFTSAAFLVYDWLVEKRQNIVMDTAVKSSAVVNELFPQQVRDRLYKNKQEQSKSSGGGSNTSKNCSQEKIDTFLTKDSPQHASDKNAVGTNDPIADLFPECTVLFCDLAGFTEWSSTRTPTDVFKLLEGIYAELDKLAKRRGVFKIETIGDCYLATTGLPIPREDHAEAMVIFACEGLRRTRKVIEEKLRHELGAETVDLTMRYGLHSGPVTGGVLRGEKARFQVFGDTVNTASRMESKGERGKIQISQATADCLISAGKESWLTKRKDLIEAKGKGTMQTYWINNKEVLRSVLVASSFRNSSMASLCDLKSIVEVP